MRHRSDGWGQVQSVSRSIDGYLPVARELLKQHPGKYGVWFLQTRLKIGYNTAKQIIEKLEAENATRTEDEAEHQNETPDC